MECLGLVLSLKSPRALVMSPLDHLDAMGDPRAKFVLKDANAPKVRLAGADVYKAQCSACHASGAAGAPKLGDKAAWAPRIKTGYDALLGSALVPTFVSFAVGTLALLAYIVAGGHKWPAAEDVAGVPPWLWLAGAVGSKSRAGGCCGLAIRNP